MDLVLHWKYSVLKNQQQDDFIKSAENQNDFIVVLTEQSNILIFDQTLQNQLFHTKVGNPIYDLMMVQNSSFILSQRDHPLTVYKDYQVYAQIHDIKPNSEQFNSPLRMRHDQNNFVGGGKGFLHQYDLNSMKLKNKLKCDKKDIVSALDISESIIAAGFYNNKEIRILRENQTLSTLKIHIGGVTYIKFVTNNYLYTGARQDDLVYLWDLRNTSTFLRYFKTDNKTNMRMNFDANSEQLILGSDNGIGHFYDNENYYPILVHEGSCVNSAQILSKDVVLFAYGQRIFENQGESGIQIFSKKQQTDQE